ncbi:hypothetical protein C0J52_04222 [Blattella germanica]|nr:hypothetical protein C0J52_04222 [Blattella germanica]
MYEDCHHIACPMLNYTQVINKIRILIQHTRCCASILFFPAGQILGYMGNLLYLIDIISANFLEKCLVVLSNLPLLAHDNL